MSVPCATDLKLIGHASALSARLSLPALIFKPICPKRSSLSSLYPLDCTQDPGKTLHEIIRVAALMLPTEDNHTA